LADKLSKRKQRAERNRKKLLSAARKVFSQKGYHKATLDEICKRASLGKGTVYQYFGNKKDLFLGIVDSFAAELGRRTADAVEGIEDDIVRLERAVSAYIQFHAGHRSFYRLLVHEESSFAKEIGERFRTKYFFHLRILEDVFRSGMKKGRMKKMAPRSATFALLGMCNLTIFRWLLSEKPYALKKEVPLILEIFLHGICRQGSRAGA
jgi:AcrR family transcriptional regulator